MYSTFKRLLVGQPLASSEEEETRLGRPTALAVFASDAISSTAYATEEILVVLVPLAALTALDYLVPIAIIVVVLLAIVVSSYRQTIMAYPQGGGAYIVSMDNLGETPALVAGASLLVDYVLTVAVSVSAGTAAIISAFQGLEDYRVPMCLAFVVLMTVANLRGRKEAGRVFAVPTYVYTVALGGLIVYGLYQSYTGDLAALPPNTEALDEWTDDGALMTGITIFALMRAFSSGAVALSGVEAISNGIPAFRKPESKNASVTLVWMAVILGSLFFGVSVLAHRLAPTITESETLLSIMGRAVFGGDNPLYFVLQFATFAILILAANTAYNDFPLLSSLVARDGYLPRQLANRGDRLVYSNGVLVLAATAGVLIVAFGGLVAGLIPLYAVGVFTGFTLSQAGMVRRHLRLRQQGWRRNVALNGLGALATGIVLIVVVVSKFTIGAWIPVVLIPLIVLVLRSIHRHYLGVSEMLAVPENYRTRRMAHTVVVLVGNVHRGVLDAITYARSLAPDRLVAVSVVSSPEEQERILAQWRKYNLPVDLHTVYSPYRDLTGPIMRFIDELDAEWADDIVTVVVPEFVLGHWWEQLLHNQSALALKSRLRTRPNTVVTAVPTQLQGRPSRAAPP